MLAVCVEYSFENTTNIRRVILRNKYIFDTPSTFFNDYLLRHNENDNNGSNNCKHTSMLLIYKENYRSHRNISKL